VSPAVLLASKSAARRALLEGARVPFEAVGSGVDEDVLKQDLLARRAGPAAIAEALADAKALAVSKTRPGLVIGADQTLELDGALYDKVETPAEAAERLRLLRGKPHRLHAAVAVASQGAVVWREMQSATLVMRDVSDAFIAEYLAHEGEAALGSVGCYRLEGMGAQLFEAIEGDYFTILGLPLLGLFELLRKEKVLSA
jgi:septum formation protein